MVLRRVSFTAPSIITCTVIELTTDSCDLLNILLDLWTRHKMADNQKRGTLIVVEGLDRAGKSSQCERLRDSLQASGHSVKYIRFPGIYSRPCIWVSDAVLTSVQTVQPQSAS